MNRAKYYSENDLSIGYNLIKCEGVIKSFDELKDYHDINEIIEFYNVYIFFQHKMKLEHWSDDEYKSYCMIAKKMKGIVYKFFNSINDDNFKELYESVWFNYKDDFWLLFNNVLDKVEISNSVFCSVFNSEHVNIYDILYNKKIVSKYSEQIREFLVNNPNISADVLVQYYIVKQEKKRLIYFPENFSMSDKANIINEYIEMKQANINYLKLLLNVSDPDLLLNIRTKKRIKERIEEIEKELFKNGVVLETLYAIKFVPDLGETIKSSITSRNVELSYDLNWIKENKDYATILNNYIYLFGYVDKQFRWSCLSKKRNIGLFELFKSRSNNDYFVSSSFHAANILVNMQQTAYYNELLSLGIRLERVIEWFFNVYLKDEFGIENFNVSMSSDNATFLEKCRNDLAEFEGILKKYNFYVEDGIIDQDLVSLTTKPILFENIKSCLNDKYVYVNDDVEFENICYALFSDQCMLAYIERYDDKFKNFYELLSKKEVLTSDINKQDKWLLDILIKYDLVSIDNDIVKINDKIAVCILKDIYENEVLSYWKVSSSIKSKVDELIKRGLIKSSSSLLSISESNYLNYMLNNRYNNSLFLRNMYVHGTQPSGDDKVHQSNYMIILRLFILLIIKINDELITKDSLEES